MKQFLQFEVKKLGWKDSSELLRKLVDDYRAKIHDPKYCKVQEHKSLDKAKYWKEMGKPQKTISPKAINILQQWFQLFKGERRQFTEPKFNKDWIKTKIIPELASAGCTAFDEGQVLDVFMDHYNHNKEVIIID